jgi:hypothetical protein
MPAHILFHQAVFQSPVSVGIGLCAVQCQLRAPSSRNVIPIRSAPVPSMWIQCLRWGSRQLRCVQQRRTCWPLWGRGTCGSDPNSTHSDLPFPRYLALTRSLATHATWRRPAHLHISLQYLSSQITDSVLSSDRSHPARIAHGAFQGVRCDSCRVRPLRGGQPSSAKSHLLHREMRRRTFNTTTPSS